MVESVYVIRKETGQMFCVSKDHYKEYSWQYDLVDLKAPAEKVEEKEEAPVDIEIVAEVKKPKGRKPTVKE